MLHKNSGKTRRSFRLGKIFFHFVVAEDPSRPWWARFWAVNDTEIIAGICRFSNTTGKSAISLILGPFKLSIARLPEATDQQNGAQP